MAVYIFRITLVALTLLALGFAIHVPAVAQDVETAADAPFDPIPIPEPTENVSRFYWTGNALYVVMTIWAILVPAIVAFSGFGAKLRNAARAIWQWPFGKPAEAPSEAKGVRHFFAARQAPIVSITYIFYMAIAFVAGLPLAFYLGYIRAHAYGLSNQTFGKWATDEVLMLVVQLIIGAAVVWVPFLLIRKLPRAWWFVTGLLICPFIFFLMLIMPVYIDPLFNDFGPMQNEELETRILTLAERAGIEGSRVYEVNKSVDTNAINAYVTGFLDTKRIVLWDTMLKNMTEQQILFIMAHEMAHYVLGHVVQGVFFFSALILLGLFLVHRIGNRLIRRFGDRLGFASLGDAAALPLIVLLMEIVMLALSPVGLAYSRHIELESDRFALELTHYNRASGQIWVDLMETNMAYPSPGPVYRFFRASHPTPEQRINFANSYHPWTTGEPLKYQHLFTPNVPAPDPPAEGAQ